MNKEEILSIFDKEYKICEEPKEIDNSLSVKLIQTTQEFARSFEYELPNAFGIKAKLTRFVKRVIRKLTRFILSPYAQQMLKFEESICELQGSVIERIYQLERDLREDKSLLQKEIEGIKYAHVEKNQQIDELNRQIDELNRQIDELGKQNRMQENLLVELQNNSTNHEVAIYKLTQAFNDNDRLTLELSNSTADIKQYLFGGDDDAFRGYSQAGEDAIISFILKYIGEKKGASYLDIGCNHFKHLSNTYHFYEKGMRGVLVDANPVFVEDIKKYRPEDTVLNVGVGAHKSDCMRFYVLNGDGLSSFNKDAVDKALKETEWLKIEREIDVPVVTINEIIGEYFHDVPTIVSIDVEGDEIALLNSIDMNTYRPLIYIVETIEYKEKLNLDNKRDDIVLLMESHDYKEYAFTGVNSIFIDKRKFV